jgi:hypothetical protein
MHSIETILKNNQQAGRIIASQAEKAQRIEAAAWAVINSKLVDEQQKAIYELRSVLTAPVADVRGPRPLEEILGPGE